MLTIGDGRSARYHARIGHCCYEGRNQISSLNEPLHLFALDHPE
jgi:hypothetical protein